MLSEVILVIVKFVERKCDLRLVCRDWRDALGQNDSDILASLHIYERNEKGKTKVKGIYECVREAISQDDINLVSSVIWEYSDFLPINWRFMDVPSGKLSDSMKGILEMNRRCWGRIPLALEAFTYRTHASIRNVGKKVSGSFDWNICDHRDLRFQVEAIDRFLREDTAIAFISHTLISDYTTFTLRIPHSMRRLMEMHGLSMAPYDTLFQYIGDYMDGHTLGKIWNYLPFERRCALLNMLLTINHPEAINYLRSIDVSNFRTRDGRGITDFGKIIFRTILAKYDLHNQTVRDVLFQTDEWEFKTSSWSAGLGANGGCPWKGLIISPRYDSRHKYILRDTQMGGRLLFPSEEKDHPLVFLCRHSIEDRDWATVLLQRTIDGY